jgi:anhydro-N-acetylmuramic acid kinase
MSQQERLIAGAMSGTSADGVDIALTKISGHGLEMSATLVQHHHQPYDPSLKQLIFSCREKQSLALGELAKMGRDISLTYSQAIRESLASSRLNSTDLTAIAAHGQTLFHQPPNTIQWLDPALIAAEINCPVISDFRRADCAAAGQGAPLVPFADYILFRHPTKNRVLLNIGGIANLTFLKAGGDLSDVIAFDTGPGNCISDYLCRKYQPSGPGYDAGGQLASRGKMHQKTSFMFARSEFAFQKPPKSTDGPAMIQLFLETKKYAKFRDASLEDELATACCCAAESILMALHKIEKYWLHLSVDEVLASGGGVKNQCLMNLLHLLAPNKIITQLDETMAQAKEAIAFALLGAATLDNFPSNIPSVTGAKRAVVLGSITPQP